MGNTFTSQQTGNPVLMDGAESTPPTSTSPDVDSRSAQVYASTRLLLLAVLLATESQLVGFGAAIGRRYDAAARHQCGLLHAAPHGLLASRIGLGFRGHRRVKKKACARARQQHSGVSGECSLPPATGEHCLLAMPLRERVRPVVSGDAMPTEPQSGAMAPRFGWGGGAKTRGSCRTPIISARARGRAAGPGLSIISRGRPAGRRGGAG